jgi:hypothetical protein
MKIAYIAQVFGLVVLSVGCGLAWFPLGIIVFGAGVLVLGALMEAHNSIPAPSPETN